MAADQLLFSYGTLQHPEVQLDTLGRLVHAEPDFLPGYTVDYAEIEDHRVVDLSGLSTHPVVRATGNPLDKVAGMALWITEDELDACDEYEVSLYHRVWARLSSGRSAWVYVAVTHADRNGGD
ncbi:gamma-glutamylcyclotransferase family protein [Microbacterium sp. C7(2022)]|uniref:gamma-glutamylcyclotransferase family protein n=1 Tax=Microbacterium sp. C7(2022) TaxID=2992759 RepID=UPI00237AE4CA|nr:gamma-glutamylcyclotransferase family protein [Microbacterium sp. C7(2022)]MDE0547065.1 gamma-glutamylcyclotransferase [Microbacterium sp. C7(2022)]